MASIETARRSAAAPECCRDAVLRDQWAASLARLCPGVRVGFEQGDTWDVADRRVVIAMVLTVAKRDFAASTPSDGFGTVEARRARGAAAASCAASAAPRRARCAIGLTATMERPRAHAAAPTGALG